MDYPVTVFGSYNTIEFKGDVADKVRLAVEEAHFIITLANVAYHPDIFVPFRRCFGPNMATGRRGCRCRKYVRSTLTEPWVTQRPSG